MEVALCFPLSKFTDIRYNYSLAGGATMDLGCYAVNMVRTLGFDAGSCFRTRETARPASGPAMTAQWRFEGGHTGRIRCSMWSSNLLQLSVKVIGESGQLQVLNPVMPQSFRRLSVRSADGKRVERFARAPSMRINWTLSSRRCYAGAGEAFAAGRGREYDGHRCDYHAAGLPVRRPAER